MPTKKSNAVRVVETPPNEPKETPNEAFRRLANKRIKPIIARLRLLAKLGSPVYKRNPDEVDKIEKTLRDELDATITELRRGQHQTEEIGDLF